ncbi:hypothetical protein LO763_25425 [Glycomyces sp. A-F 0318]|uniref:hypothetical protein n=1 Tax=Glycomyces amatae TaxID=2881355 RepID=UPI001E45114B|nr:hypothetical protein [Glycomyces amatae]MCD0446966.1 hypothetical protein [Glycomyces amatae]
MTTLKQPERAAAKRPLLIALYAGLALSVIGAVAPYLDIATADTIGAHVRDAYPDWPASDVQKDRDAIALALALLGGLGAVTWIVAIATAGKRWARWFVTAAFAVGTVLALSIGFMGGEAYSTIAPPAYGALVTLPCLAGLAAAVLVWRRRD